MSAETKRETLLLFDGNNLVYRSFFAMPRLENRSGLLTNAVYGFATVLRKVLAEEPTALAAVTFDAGGKTFRHERYEAYKANRPPTPDELKQQLPYTRKLCDALGLRTIEQPGVEADDLIGTLARRAVASGLRVLIVSSDKDLLQLVSDDVTVIHPVKYDHLDPDAVRRKFGVGPEQVPDVLALIGDSIDNVPGVHGIGEKGASKLIGEWGSLEALIEHASEVKNKRQREALLEHADQARLSKELVTIASDLDLDVPLEELRYRGANREACYRLFEELGFTTLLEDYMPAVEPKDLTASYRSLSSIAELDRLLADGRREGKLALSLDVTPTKRFDPWGARLLGAGLAVKPGEGVWVRTGGTLEEAALVERLGAVLADPAIAKVGHDVKHIVTFFGARGLAVRGIGFDTRIAAYVLNPSRRSQELSALLVEFLQTKLTPERAAGDAQGVLPGMEAAGADEASRGRLDAERAERLLRLEERMAARIAEEELDGVYRELELPLVEVLAGMELAGIAIDRAEFEAMSRELATELDALTREIYEIAGEEFNINSPKQLAEILFEKMNLPTFKKTQKQRLASTRVDVLESLANFELPRKILDYRSLAKLKGTYVDALPSIVHPGTGRIHTTFNQTVAATGRLSSSEPNLQNIPIRTELGRRLRRAFVAEPGHTLLSADYSQIELRVLAHLSGDEALIEAFREGQDIHERTAVQVFGASSDLSETEKRRRAKIINFSIIYGKTAFTLGKEFGVPTREAQAFIDAYFDRYPRVRELIDSIVRETRRTGKVRTMFGRQRYVPEIASRNRSTRAAAERVAVNTPIQGSAADLIKKAMIDLWRRLEREAPSTRLLLQVHDELVLETPEHGVDAVADLVRETMESVHPMSVPLKVDMKRGPSWEH